MDGSRESSVLSGYHADQLGVPDIQPPLIGSFVIIFIDFMMAQRLRPEAATTRDSQLFTESLQAFYELDHRAIVELLCSKFESFRLGDSVRVGARGLQFKIFRRLNDLTQNYLGTQIRRKTGHICNVDTVV